MGLDIKFILEAAKQAGMVVYKQRNGSIDEINTAEKEHKIDPHAITKDYLEWLGEEELLGKLTDYPYAFVVDECSDGSAFVRANKWGNLYEPLTSFLKANNITWGEF